MASPTRSTQEIKFIEQSEQEEYKNPLPNEEENQLARGLSDIKIVATSTESLKTPEPKPRKTLGRTVSGFLDKKIKKDSPKTETEQLWQKAKKRWPSSTLGVNSASEYKEFRREYSEEIFPNLISSGKSLEEILDDIERRSANLKVWSAWLNSNSQGSFEEFASQNKGWLEYCEMIASQTRSYRKSTAWENYNTRTSLSDTPPSPKDEASGAIDK